MRPTVAKIDLAALRKNLKKIREIVGQDVGVIPIVKADAYGHGAVAIAWVLAEMGIDLMAVACVEEALDLADAGLPARLLLLGGLCEETSLVEVPPNCVPVVWDKNGVNLAASLPSSVGRPIEIHLKVNTGMSRLGCEPSELPAIFECARERPQVRITGVMSHLASADILEPDGESFTKKQIVDFNALCKPLSTGMLRHLSASAGIVKYPESHFDAVRPGLMLYGIWPFGANGAVNGLTRKDVAPVLSLMTKVMVVRQLTEGESVGYGRTFVAKRPTKVAVLPVGYADGLSRKLSNRGQVLIGGKRRNIIGLVSMDYITVDVTDAPPVNIRDDVVLIGRQGNDEITAWDVAKWSETIPYEVTCSISRRVPRMVVDDY